MFRDLHPVIAHGCLSMHHFKSTKSKKRSNIPFFTDTRYLKNTLKSQESCILNTFNHFMKNNTSLPLNLNSFKLLIHKPPLQPSLLPMKIDEEESNKFTVSDTTTTAKHCNNADDTIYRISGITCFSLLISNTFLFNVISTCEANETSSSEKIPLYTFSIITYIPSMLVWYPNQLY